MIKAIVEEVKDFAVIVFDAHSDLREPWGQDTWNHACVTREISKELNLKTLIVGVRSQDYYEKEFAIENKDKISIIYAKDLLNSKNNSFDLLNCKIFENEIKKLPKNIFISIDVDVFDSTIISNTNTCEPGGLNCIQLNNLLISLFKTKNIIGVDINEFSPKTLDNKENNSYNESYLLAKLIYKIIAYKYYSDKL
ncbi:MAG: arginase family protein [archaeon]